MITIKDLAQAITADPSIHALTICVDVQGNFTVSIKPRSDAYTVSSSNPEMDKALGVTLAIWERTRIQT